MGLSLGVVGGLVAFVGVLCLWVGWVCGCLGAYLFTHTYRGADQVFYAHLGLPSLYSLLVYFLVYIKQMEAGPTTIKVESAKQKPKSTRSKVKECNRGAFTETNQSTADEMGVSPCGVLNQ